MPSGPASLKELAALGLDHAFMSGAAKYLRSASRMTIHSKGGGAAAHWTVRDYLLLTTSLAGDLPSDAPTVAPALAQLPHVMTLREHSITKRVADHEGPADFTFGDWFENDVTQISSLTGDALQQEVSAAQGATITMSLFPYRVEVKFYGGGEDGSETLRIIFEAPPPPPFEGQNALYRPDLVHKTSLWRERTTVIPYNVVLACASLLARVPANAKAVPPSGSGVTTATLERETPEPHHKAPAPVRKNQPHANAARPSHSLEATEIGIGLQYPSVPRVRRPPTVGKDTLHHAQVVQS